MGTRISLCTDKIQKSKIETEWSNFTFLLKSDFDGINLNPFHFPPKLINEIDSLKRVIVNAIINFLFHENVFSILRTSKIYRDNPTQEKALAEFVLSFIDRPREKYKKEMKQLMATGPGFLGLHVIEAIRRIERE